MGDESAGGGQGSEPAPNYIKGGVQMTGDAPGSGASQQGQADNSQQGPMDSGAEENQQGPLQGGAEDENSKQSCPNQAPPPAKPQEAIDMAPYMNYIQNSVNNAFNNSVKQFNQGKSPSQSYAPGYANVRGTINMDENGSYSFQLDRAASTIDGTNGAQMGNFANGQLSAGTAAGQFAFPEGFEGNSVPIGVELAYNMPPRVKFQAPAATKN